MPRSNRLLPLLVSIVVLMLVFVGLRSCSEDPLGPAVMDIVPRAPVPDADTPADTIKTLTANVAAMTAELEALRREGDRLRDENRGLLEDRSRLEQNVMHRMHKELQAREHAHEARKRADSSVLAALTERVDALTRSLSEHPRPDPRQLPVGPGLESADPGLSRDARTVWIDPLDTLTPGDRDTSDEARLPYPVAHPADKGAALALGRDGKGILEVDLLRPAYTVPRNATLIGSTTLTALVGRIPVQGQVRDPMPFKVITGSENLAANGLTVPGVQGMVWSGTAIGDWTLSCVTGQLDSVTFVFDDGTIRTISSGMPEGGASGTGRQSLGWISDRQGIPCISGERKTNAPAFLGQRIGMMAVQAAADAEAAAQTTTAVRETGTTVNTVTGDSGAFVLGRTVAGGSQEVARWFKERQSQSFDAVFVPAGVPVAIHVDVALPIDLDLKGRKLDYAQAIDPHHRTRLD